MKFAHQLKEALRQEGFPPHWVESAVPYAQLKKCIKKVEIELKELGLDAETLRHLTPSYSPPGEQQNHRASGSTAIAFQYKFAREFDLYVGGSSSNNCTTEEPGPFKPKLTLYIQLEDGVAIDANLSPSTKKYLEDLAAEQGKSSTAQARDLQVENIQDQQKALINQ